MVAKAKFGKTPSRDKQKCSPGSYPEIKVDEIDKYSRTIQCVYHILVPLNKGIIIDHNEIQLQTHYQIKKNYRSQSSHCPASLGTKRDRIWFY